MLSQNAHIPYYLNAIVKCISIKFLKIFQYYLILLITFIRIILKFIKIN